MVHKLNTRVLWNTTKYIICFANPAKIGLTFIRSHCTAIVLAIVSFVYNNVSENRSHVSEFVVAHRLNITDLECCLDKLLHHPNIYKCLDLANSLSLALNDFVPLDPPISCSFVH